MVIVFNGVATVKRVSETEIPIVLVPRSNPRIALHDFKHKEKSSKFSKRLANAVLSYFQILFCLISFVSALCVLRYYNYVVTSL